LYRGSNGVKEERSRAENGNSPLQKIKTYGKKNKGGEQNPVEKGGRRRGRRKKIPAEN